VTSLENPFRSERLEALAFRFPAGDSWPAFFARLADAGGRGALVGAKGSGKTCALEELAGHLRTRGLPVTLVRLSVGTPAPWSLTVRPGQALLIDGAEQLSWPAWLWLRWRAQRAAVFVVTTHRPGRLPALLHTRATPALLAELVAELAPSAAIPQLPHLFALHAANLREVLRALYDLHARCA
jgi:hypothetical protein